MTPEYKEALAELRRAETNFNNAEPEFIDSANALLTAARMRVDGLLKQERIRP